MLITIGAERVHRESNRNRFERLEFTLPELEIHLNNWPASLDKMLPSSMGTNNE